MRREPINLDDYDEKDLLKMKKREAVEGLNEMQQRFCEHYVHSYNVKMAAIKAGYADDAASNMGYLLRRKESVQLYICWLKARILKSAFVSAADIIDHYIRIAFSDITDYVEIHQRTVTLKSAEKMDGQLIKSIKSTNLGGVTIELYDKIKALDSLARYVEDMPKDWKQKIEEKRMELMEQEFELKKKNAENGDENVEDDGFIKALEETAKTVWKNT
jgi:phage terminase small subunit